MTLETGTEQTSILDLSQLVISCLPYQHFAPNRSGEEGWAFNSVTFCNHVPMIISDRNEEVYLYSQVFASTKGYNFIFPHYEVAAFTSTQYVTFINNVCTFCVLVSFLESGCPTSLSVCGKSLLLHPQFLGVLHCISSGHTLLYSRG